ncbi:MAG: cupin domain-containing protein [Chloroflexi bacterium]|nr:cupin domain-containing protein [Chloroflexota bacterium]
MAKVFRKEELPHFDSTRDGRDRMDLITDNVPVGATKIKADRIIYHPGDTCAKHYHVGCYHLFVMLEGEATICSPSGCQTFTAGQVAVIAPEEVHWFENHSAADYRFVEFWAPPPTETVWIVEDDI